MSNCPIQGCSSSVKDLYDHARKYHKDLKWSSELAQKVGGVACTCGTLAKSHLGIKQHQAKNDNCKSLFLSKNTDNVTSIPKSSISSNNNNMKKPTTTTTSTLFKPTISSQSKIKNNDKLTTTSSTTTTSIKSISTSTKIIPSNKSTINPPPIKLTSLSEIPINNISLAKSINENITTNVINPTSENTLSSVGLSSSTTNNSIEFYTSHSSKLLTTIVPEPSPSPPSLKSKINHLFECNSSNSTSFLNKKNLIIFHRENLSKTSCSTSLSALPTTNPPLSPLQTTPQSPSKISSLSSDSSFYPYDLTPAPLSPPSESSSITSQFQSQSISEINSSITSFSNSLSPVTTSSKPSSRSSTTTSSITSISSANSESNSNSESSSSSSIISSLNGSISSSLSHSSESSYSPSSSSHYSPDSISSLSSLSKHNINISIDNDLSNPVPNIENFYEEKSKNSNNGIPTFSNSSSVTSNTSSLFDIPTITSPDNGQETICVPDLNIRFNPSNADDLSTSPTFSESNTVSDNTGINDESFTDLFIKLSLFPLRKLHKALHDDFVQVLERLCSNYIINSTEQNLFYILALPKMGLFSYKNKAWDISKGKIKLLKYPDNIKNDILNGFNKYSNDNIKTDINKKTSNDEAKKYIKQGFYAKACNSLLNKAAIAPINSDTVNKLKELHFNTETDTVKSNASGFLSKVILKDKRKGKDPGFNITEQIIINMANKFSPGTGTGISGWNISLIHLCINKSKKFTEFLVLLCKQIINGTAPGNTMLCAGKLIPLIKQDGISIRPICVGELFYRIIMKSILFNIKGKIHDMILTNQFGVGSACGVEPILLRAEQVLNEYKNNNNSYIISPRTENLDNLTSEDYDDNYDDNNNILIDEYNTNGYISNSIRGIACIDISNAFNSICRQLILDSIRKYCPKLERVYKWTYGYTTPLIIPNTDITIDSCKGIRQGDPFGPLFFSMGFRFVIENIQQKVPGVEILSYLDDITAFCTSKDKFYKIISVIKGLDKYGFKVNVEKSKYYNIMNIINNIDSNENNNNNSINDYNKIIMLGSCIGSVSQRLKFLNSKIDVIEENLNKLNKLSSQEAYLILRYCISQKLRHLLRSLDPTGLSSAWARLDDVLVNYIKSLRGNSNINDNKYSSTIIQLPLRYGGLGILTHSKYCEIIRNSAMAASADVLAGISPNIDYNIKSILDKYYLLDFNKLLDDLTNTEAVQVWDMNSKISKAWLTTAPENKYLTLSDPQVSTYFQAKTLHVPSLTCLNCGKINTCNHHEICLSGNNYKIARHELIKKSLARALIKSGNDITIEPFLYKDNIYNDRTKTSLDENNEENDFNEKDTNNINISNNNNITNNHLRSDIKVSGPSAPRQGSCFIDVSVITLASNKSTAITSSSKPSPLISSSFTVTNKNNKDDDISTISATATSTASATFSPATIKKNISNRLENKIQEALDARHRFKINKYQKNTNLPLLTFCITSSGTLHSTALELIRNIPQRKNLIPEISVILARSRYQFSRSSSSSTFQSISTRINSKSRLAPAISIKTKAKAKTDNKIKTKNKTIFQGLSKNNQMNNDPNNNDKEEPVNISPEAITTKTQATVDDHFEL